VYSKHKQECLLTFGWFWYTGNSEFEIFSEIICEIVDIFFKRSERKEATVTQKTFNLLFKIKYIEISKRSYFKRFLF